MKLLLSAYACEPNRGSEEGVGWNVVIQAAKHHEVWVLTRSFYRSAIEAELNRQQLSNLHFIYFDPFNWTADWRDTQGAVQLHYYLWQIQAYFIGRSLQKEVKFDVIRHVTYVKYWSPSFLSLLPVPFIWGPVGGGESAPKPFWKDFNLYGRTYETLRAWAQRTGELDPFTRMTARRSLLAQATTDDTAKRLAYLGAQNVHLCSESGLSINEIERLAQQPLPPNEPIRFISMGRLLHWKAYHLSIMAFHAANIPNAEYWLLGNGSERKRLEALCEKLNISSQVKFLGRLPREETLTRLAQSHVLVHPSLHDSGGWTCLEGMAAGRPVICLDLGGPATQVTHETGIKIPAYNPEQTVQEIANAMSRLAKDSDLRLRLGQAGQRRVRDEFSWDSIGQAFDETCRQIAALAS